MSIDQLSQLNLRPVFSTPGALPTIRQTSSLAGTYRQRGGSHVLDNFDTPASGRVDEYGDNCGQKNHPDIEEGMSGWYDDAWTLDFWINFDGIRQAGGLVANRMMGVQIGSHRQDPPFPAAPSYGVTQVRFCLRSGGFDDMTLYVSPGDGITNATETRFHLGQNSGVTGFNATLNQARKVRLSYNPATGVTSCKVWDAFDAIFRTANITAPHAAGAHDAGLGLFSYTGAGACGNQFSVSNGMLYVPRSDWGLG